LEERSASIVRMARLVYEDAEVLSSNIVVACVRGLRQLSQSADQEQATCTFYVIFTSPTGEARNTSVGC
jgi:hypothetical protein